MSIGAGGIVRAGLMLVLALGTTTARAQAPANGTWTDPPARNVAPQQAVPAPVAPTKESAPALAPAPTVAKAPSEPVAEGRTSVARSARPAPVAARPATVPRRLREAAKRPPAVDRPPRTHVAAPRILAAPRIVERRFAVRPAPRRVVAQAFAPQPYPYGPLPVGRVEGPVDGERRPIFAEGSDRMRRIAAAEAAGYLVVRARTVQFPNGRMMREVRPYDEDDGLD